MAELLWFRAIGYEGVFWRLRIAEVAMFAIAFVSSPKICEPKHQRAA